MIFLKQNSQKLGGDLKKSFFFFCSFWKCCGAAVGVLMDWEMYFWTERIGLKVAV